MGRKYYYLHTNGKLIEKPAFVVENGDSPSSYFNSPFVIKYWVAEEEGDYEIILEDAKKIAEKYKK